MRKISKQICGLVTSVIFATSTTSLANENSANTNPSGMDESKFQPLTGHDLCRKWALQAKGMFPVVCGERMKEEIVLKGAEDSSHSQLFLLVLGGNDELKLEGLKLVHKMAVEGKSVAIGFGPDRDGSHLSVEYLVFAHGKPALRVEQVGMGHIKTIGPVFGERINDAYKSNYHR